MPLGSKLHTLYQGLACRRCMRIEPLRKGKNLWPGGFGFFSHRIVVVVVVEVEGRIGSVFPLSENRGHRILWHLGFMSIRKGDSEKANNSLKDTGSMEALLAIEQTCPVLSAQDISGGMFFPQICVMPALSYPLEFYPNHFLRDVFPLLPIRFPQPHSIPSS